MIFLFALYLN